MRPRRACDWILCLLGAIALTAGPLRASAAPPDSASSEPAFHVECSGTYASWYSFQGFDYSNRRPVFQPELKGTLGPVSVGVWGNLDQSSGNLDEVDMTYRFGWEGAHTSGGLGYVNLQYPNRPDGEPSQEIFAEGELSGPIQASASVHWDVDRGRGRYWALGVGHEISAPAIGLGVKLYAQEHYYGLTGISAIETRASVRRTWGGVEWEPAVSRLWTWRNGDLRGEDAVEAGWLLSVSFSPP